MQAKLWTPSALAAECGKSPRWMAKWLEDNVKPIEEKPEKGRVKRFYRFSDVFAAAVYGDSQKIDPNRERARKEAAQREKLELEIAVMKGELVPWEMVKHAWDAMLSRFRARILPLGGVLAVKVQTLDKFEECKEAIDREHHDALQELSTAETEVYAHSGDIATPSEANGESVGGQGEEIEPGGERGAGDMAH